jgi:hypothetical protein
VYSGGMRKTLSRTVTVGTLILALLAAFVLAASPASAAVEDFTVDGMDGIITITDTHGNQMTVTADCARVIADNTTDLVQLHRDGTTALPEYVEACF